MAGKDLSQIQDQELDAELAVLAAAAARALDPCLTGKLIAYSDVDVRTLFLQKCRNGYPFKGVACIPYDRNPDHVHVLFDFDCKPTTLCLVDPSFLVTVNIATRTVVKPIHDPYLPLSRASANYSTCCEECGDHSEVVRRQYEDQSGKRRIDLGRQYWKEFRDHLTKPCRNCKAFWYCELSHPRINEIWGDVTDCLRVAAVAAAITALLSGAGSAAAFDAALKACLIAKGIGWADEINFKTDHEPTECGNWSLGACTD
jgi:hypothetical protein